MVKWNFTSPGKNPFGHPLETSTIEPPCRKPFWHPWLGLHLPDAELKRTIIINDIQYAVLRILHWISIGENTTRSLPYFCWVAIFSFSTFCNESSVLFWSGGCDGPPGRLCSRAASRTDPWSAATRHNRSLLWRGTRAFLRKKEQAKMWRTGLTRELQPQKRIQLSASFEIHDVSCFYAVLLNRTPRGEIGGVRGNRARDVFLSTAMSRRTKVLLFRPIF